MTQIHTLVLLVIYLKKKSFNNFQPHATNDILTTLPNYALCFLIFSVVVANFIMSGSGGGCQNWTGN